MTTIRANGHRVKVNVVTKTTKKPSRLWGKKHRVAFGFVVQDDSSRKEMAKTGVWSRIKRALKGQA